jgi:hypothetical protein
MESRRVTVSSLNLLHVCLEGEDRPLVIRNFTRPVSDHITLDYQSVPGSPNRDNQNYSFVSLHTQHHADTHMLLNELLFLKSPIDQLMISN